MSRIVTRGLGTRNMLVTRGYGSFLGRLWHRVIRVFSPVGVLLQRISEWRQTS